MNQIKHTQTNLERFDEKMIDDIERLNLYIEFTKPDPEVFYEGYEEEIEVNENNSDKDSLETDED